MCNRYCSVCWGQHSSYELHYGINESTETAMFIVWFGNGPEGADGVCSGKGAGPLLSRERETRDTDRQTNH